MSKTVHNLRAAWEQRGERAGEVIVAAINAPLLFKPDTVAAAHATFNRAVSEYRRWAS